MRWVDDVAERDDLDCRETLLLTKFAAYADAGMESWAAVATLMRQSRSSERKVQYMLREFEARGYIRKTGELHRLPGSTRGVPIYVFCGFLADFEAEEDAGAGRAGAGGPEGPTTAAEAARMGAPGAPMDGHGCTDGGGMGAQGVHPHNEPIEPTSPGGEGARARAGEPGGDFEALFGRLEAAFPRLGLGATFRDRARAALKALLAEGADGEALVAAAGRYAADRTWKRKDLGLDHWLHDRRFRAWMAEPEGAAVSAGDAGAVGGPPELPRDVADVVFSQGRDWVASWLNRAVWREADGERVLACATGIGRDRVRERVGARLAEIGVSVVSVKELPPAGPGGLAGRGEG